MDTNKYVRRPFFVDAVQVTEENFDDVLVWCEGSRQTDAQGDIHIRVKVRHPLNARQTKAYVGDWVLKAGEGFKVYNAKAFEKSFQPNDEIDLNEYTISIDPRQKEKLPIFDFAGDEGYRVIKTAKGLREEMTEEDHLAAEGKI